MRYLLARANRSVLQQLVWSDLLLAFDFDGTLAPIVANPSHATMRPSSRRLLRELAGCFPCVVISGRARADVIRRMGGVPAVEVVGNHGIEPRQIPRRVPRVVRIWQSILARKLARLQGVWIEDKSYSISIHFRASRQKKKARLTIQEASSALHGVRLIWGKQVLNVLPAESPHKGVALEKARRRFGCDTALYVGDDETDEDVFSLEQPGRMLTVRVGRKKDSLAAYYIREQGEIDDLLRTLLDLARENRSGGVGRGRR